MSLVSVQDDLYFLKREFEKFTGMRGLVKRLSCDKNGLMVTIKSAFILFKKTLNIKTLILVYKTLLY